MLPSPGEETLYDVILKVVNSFVKWDVLRQMHAQADQFFSLERLAQVTQRRAEELFLSLNELTAEGMIEREQDRFTLTRDPIRRRWVEAFMRACQNTEFRLRVVRFLTRGTPNLPQTARG